MNRRSQAQVIDACVVDAEADTGGADAPTVPAAALPAEIEDAAVMFGLLADSGRLRLLHALLPGEMCVCDLAAATGQSASSVSHALRLLRAHRTVRVRRAGRRAFYRLDDTHVRAVVELSLAHQRHADGPARAGAVHG